MRKISKDSKVAVAISGGVDSGVAAALLVEQGYKVVGLFMENRYTYHVMKNILFILSAHMVQVNMRLRCTFSFSTKILVLITQLFAILMFMALGRTLMGRQVSLQSFQG